jgi:hypothetical protein
MKSLFRNEWIDDADLKKWRNRECTYNTKCQCNDESNLVELCEHDSCTRGRIDTVICTTCEGVHSIKIIR